MTQPRLACACSPLACCGSFLARSRLRPPGVQCYLCGREITGGLVPTHYLPFNIWNGCPSQQFAAAPRSAWEAACRRIMAFFQLVSVAITLAPPAAVLTLLTVLLCPCIVVRSTRQYGGGCAGFAQVLRRLMMLHMGAVAALLCAATWPLLMLSSVAAALICFPCAAIAARILHQRRNLEAAAAAQAAAARAAVTAQLQATAGAAGAAGAPEAGRPVETGGGAADAPATRSAVAEHTSTTRAGSEGGEGGQVTTMDHRRQNAPQRTAAEAAAAAGGAGAAQAQAVDARGGDAPAVLGASDIFAAAAAAAMGAVAAPMEAFAAATTAGMFPDV